ncbi:hypothetical protein D3C75_808860 [compost metagenome]
MVIGIAQASSIDNVQRHAVDVDMFAQDIPRGAGNISNDGRFPPGQLVQQARLAGIWPTGDDHGHTVTQQGALPGFTLYFGQLAPHRIEHRQHVAVGEEVDFLFREVDRRLDVDTQRNQRLGQEVHALGELPL